MNRVYYWHFRALKYCNRGLKAWFARRGILFQDVVDNGVPADLLLESGDAMAVRAVEFAESTGFSQNPPAENGGE